MTANSDRPQNCALVVLDTNVVLDWLLFNDRRCDALVALLVKGSVVWVATAAMRQELAQVLASGTLDAWLTDEASVWDRWDQHALMVSPGPLRAHSHPRCSDPDDQKFIDLGLHVGATALLSRDRAVLRCARRARSFGLEIHRPEDWVRR